MHLADFVTQASHDRQQDRLAAAAVHRLVRSSPARVRMARTGAKRDPRRRLLEPPPGLSAGFSAS